MNSKDFDRIVFEFFKNYHDRGMVKWQGFYLSDHVLKMHKKHKAESYVEIKKEEMSESEISAVLFKAFGEQRLVRIQLAMLDQEGIRPRSFTGHVLGFDEDKVVIDKQIVDLADIGHAEIVAV